VPRDYTLGSTPNAWTRQKAPTDEQLDALDPSVFSENPVKGTRTVQDAAVRQPKPSQHSTSAGRAPAPQKPRKPAPRPAPARAPDPRPAPAPPRARPMPPKTQRRSKGATEHRFLASFTLDGWRRLEASSKRTGQSAAAILRVLVDEHLDPA